MRSIKGSLKHYSTEQKMKDEQPCILVSACILGENCKFNGKNNYSARAVAYLAGKKVLPICPEILAGLPTPREPAEFINGRVTECSGRDVHEIYQHGVAQAMAAIGQRKISHAVLQSRSPTCGVNCVYDGSFTGKLVAGSGLFAQRLRELGIEVVDVEDV